MKRKLKILGVGAIISIVSAAGVGFLTAAIMILWNLSQLSGYTAVLAFLIAIVSVVGAIRVIFGIGVCINNAAEK